MHDGRGSSVQMLDELALDGVAQLGGFIEQGTDLFLALAELFSGPEERTCAALSTMPASTPRSMSSPGEMPSTPDDVELGFAEGRGHLVFDHPSRGREP